MTQIYKFLLTMCSILLLNGCSNEETSSLYKLLIYYGTPIGVNEVWNKDEAAEIFAHYDYIVFGEGLENPADHHHESTKAIIPKIRELHEGVKIFGYVNIGVTNKNEPYSRLLEHYKNWKLMGVDGIFFDCAGFDYGVSRDRLNASLQTVHSLGMPAFVNAWDPDDVMGNERHPVYNPDRVETEMREGDYYLLEEFLRPYNATNSLSSLFRNEFQAKMDKVIQYRKDLGVKMLSISRIDYSRFSDLELDEFFHMNEAAAGVFSLDGYSVSSVEYGSSKADEDIVRWYPYMENYMQHYTTNVKYLSNGTGREFWRGRFFVSSNKGEHIYKVP